MNASDQRPTTSGGKRGPAEEVLDSGLHWLYVLEGGQPQPGAMLHAVRGGRGPRPIDRQGSMPGFRALCGYFIGARVQIGTVAYEVARHPWPPLCQTCYQAMTNRDLREREPEQPDYRAEAARLMSPEAYVHDAEYHAGIERLKHWLRITDAAMSDEGIDPAARKRIRERLVYGFTPATGEAALSAAAARRLPLVGCSCNPAGGDCDEGCARCRMLRGVGFGRCAAVVLAEQRDAAVARLIVHPAHCICTGASACLATCPACFARPHGAPCVATW